MKQTKRQKKAFEILSKLLDKDQLTYYENELIYQNPDGSYSLFGIYSIQKNDTKYFVTKMGTFTLMEFVELKNAVTWTILDKRGKYQEGQEVFNLDRQLMSAIESGKVHDKLCKNTKDTEQKSIYLIKLNEDRNKKRIIHEKLEDYIVKCNRWQMEQFKKYAEK